MRSREFTVARFLLYDNLKLLFFLSQDSPLPLEFRTSPPAGAHRSYPTRSLSPPPKLFLADGGDDEDRQNCTAHQSAITGSDPSPVNALTSLPANSGAGSTLTTTATAAGSPRKRHHRHHHAHHRSQQHHHVQRPCLDFEKMQQVSFTILFNYAN